jgi:hypothetical protein
MIKFFPDLTFSSQCPYCRSTLNTRKIPLLSGSISGDDDIRVFLNHMCPNLIYVFFKTRELKSLSFEAIDWGDCLTIVNFICRFGFKIQVSEPKLSSGYFLKYNIKPANQKYLNPFPFIVKFFSILLVPYDPQKPLLYVKVSISLSKQSLGFLSKKIYYLAPLKLIELT